MQHALLRQLCQRVYLRAQGMDCRFFSLRNFVINSKLRKQIEKVLFTMPRRRRLRYHHPTYRSHRHHRRRYPRHRRH